MRKIILLFVGLFAVLVGKAQNKNLIPVNQNSKIGFLHPSTYQIVIPFQHTWTEQNKAGAIVGQIYVDENFTKSYFYDKEGKELLRLENKNYYYPFHEGVSRFRNRENFYQYINLQGKQLGTTFYETAYDFHEGVAVAKEKKEGLPFILLNPQGKTILALNPEYSHVSSFSEGLSFVIEGNYLEWATSTDFGLSRDEEFETPIGKLKAIDKQGKVVLDFSSNKEIQYARAFQQGLAVVGVQAVNYDGFEGQYPLTTLGVIDKTGKIIVPIQYSEITIEPQGTILAKKASGEMLVFDKQGKAILNGGETQKYYAISSLMGNRFRLVQENSQDAKWGVVDMSNGNKEIVPPQYENVFFKAPTDFWAIEKWDIVKKFDEYINEEVTIGKEGYVTFYTYKRAATPKQSKLTCPDFSYTPTFSFKYNDKQGLVSNLEVVAVGYDSLAKINNASPFWMAQKRDKWGIIDEQGNEVLKPQFEQSTPFQSYYAPVKKNKKWGMIDLKGKIIIPFEYDTIATTSFYQDNIYLLKKNGFWGALNNERKPYLPLEYKDLEVINQQYLLVTQKDGRKNIKNYELKDLFKDSYTHIASLPQSSLWEVGNAGKVGALDLEDGLLTPIRYEKVKPMPNSPNLIFVYLNGKVGLAKEGKEILPTEYDQIDMMRDGNYFKVKKNGKIGVLDKDLKEFVPCLYDKIGNEYRFFGSDYTYITFEQNGLIGFFDQTGKVISPAMYQEIDLYEPPFVAKKDGKFGLIDANNKTIIPFEFEILHYTYSKNGTILRVTKDSKEALYSKTGEVLIPLTYNELGRFVIDDGMPMGVMVGKKWGYINAKQKMTIKPQYDDAEVVVKVQNKLFAIVKKGENWGVIDMKNKVVLPFVYTSLYWEDTAKGQFNANKGDKEMIIDLKGNEVKK
jgi:hypothetical protein